MSKKSAIYPGTFDPITRGHKDIILRASSIFDELFVAVATKVSKKPLFSMEQRKEMISLVVKDLANVRVVSFNNLLTSYIKEIGVSTIIRGLRAISDFEYEFQMALMNNSLDKSVETIFFMSKLEYSFVSSGLIKEIALSGGDISSFIPEEIMPVISKEFRIE